MKRSLFVIIVSLCSCHAAMAQEPIRLTLDQAIALGMQASHRLAEMTARQDAARAVAEQRSAAGQPQLAALASYMRINHNEEFGVPDPVVGRRLIYPDLPNIMRSRIDLQWPIYTGGSIDALSRAARAEIEATGQDREAARADLKLDITRAFWAVVTSRASSVVVRQALERTTAHLTDVRNQLDVGLVPPSDVLTIEAHLAHEQMLSIESDSIVEATAADFRRLVGLDPDARFELIANLAAPPVPSVPQPIAAAVSLARANRAERKSLEFRIRAADERTQATSAGNLPHLNVVAGYDMARPNLRILPIEDKWTPSWDVGVQVRWSFFDGGKVKAETAEAAANRRGVEARLREFDSAIEAEVRERTASLNAARASIEAAEAGRRAAAEARRVLAERFAAGVATNTDVLNAQVALLQAELDATRARANTQLAAARLDRALGR